MNGLWSRALLARYQVPEVPGTGSVEQLRVEPSLITARVGDESVSLSSPPIPSGIWAAIEPIRTDAQSEYLLQTLDHTWEEPLIPAQITGVGSADAVEAVVRAFAGAVDADPSLLLRWRGYATDERTDVEPWHGRELPELPPPARRPPDSVPKRFGSSGIPSGRGDVVEALVTAYAAFNSRRSP